MELVFRNRLALMVEQTICVRSQYFLNSPKHELLRVKYSNSSFIQQAKKQRENGADQNGSSERKVKRKVVALVMKVERKTAKPEWQPRSEHEQKTNNRQN